jgi:hypothetical protein
MAMLDFWLEERANCSQQSAWVATTLMTRSAAKCLLYE